jgi:hypothetical protein
MGKRTAIGVGRFTLTAVMGCERVAPFRSEGFNPFTHTMKKLFVRAAGLLLLSTLNYHLSIAMAQGTAFSYQGRLNSSDSPATGIFDFRFKLYTDPYGDNQVGSSYLTNGVPVTNGLFLTTIDFGPGIFTGNTNWLEVDVRTNGAGSYTVLSPLQGVTPTPSAIFAETANNLSGPLPSPNLSGTYGNALTLNNAGNSFSGSFSGNGTNVTGVNAAALNGLSSSNFWQLGGNNVSAGQFLGSTNNQPVIIAVNGQEAERFELPATNAPNVIGGFAGNFVSGPMAFGVTIGGGGTTGETNSIQGTNATFATIAGGVANTISGVNAYHSAIGGGFNNAIAGDSVYESVIAGGFNSSIGSQNSFIGGGYQNIIQTNSPFSAVGGGYYNTIQPNTYGSIIAGGFDNIIQTNADHGVISGGWQNQVEPFGWESVISGGELNDIGPGAQWSVIGGGEFNTNDSSYAVISGGIYNLVQMGDESVIAGGFNNVISSNSYQAVIGGGFANEILPSNYHSVIDGGALNLIQNFAHDSVIGGGYQNVINFSANNGFIGGGYLNTIQSNAIYSTIGGGLSNLVTGAYGTVPGGSSNVASGMFSFAAGQQAQALHQGTFVWADSQNVPFASGGSNQFDVRATGGVNLVTAGAGLTLDGQPVLAGINGASLTNVNAATVNGLAATAFAPASGSANYIQNQTGTAQAASFNISGNAQVGGLIRSGSESGTAEPPVPAGLVVRRINSTGTSQTSNSVVAACGGLTLVRDGSNAGFQIKYPANPGLITIACMGMNTSGGQVNYYTSLPNPSTAGTVQIYSNSQNVAHFECTFGITFDAGQPLTQVTLSRYGTDYYWSGTVISSYNQ